MADREPVSYAYKHQDLLAVILRDKGIHEGLWMLQVRFGLGAGNAGPSTDDMNPTAFVPVLSIGITEAKQEGPLIVDAAKVNSAPQAKRKARITG